MAFTGPTKDRIFGFIVSNRKSIIFRAIKFAAYNYIAAINNHNYAEKYNGEKFFINKLARKCEICTIFDVGANVGQWATMAARLFPNAKIDSFELSPGNQKQFLDNSKNISNINPHLFGLGDKTEDIKIYHYENNPERSSLFDHGDEESTLYTGSIKNGDQFCAENSISNIDLLKIDVEGAELKVLLGFSGMLKQGKIKFIQFERACASSYYVMRDLYDLLGESGYLIGKLYPNGVDIRPYHWSIEGELASNWVAFRPEMERIVNAP